MALLMLGIALVPWPVWVACGLLILFDIIT
jgi:hypothetical protein